MLLLLNTIRYANDDTVLLASKIQHLHELLTLIAKKKLIRLCANVKKTKWFVFSKSQDHV